MILESSFSINIDSSSASRGYDHLNHPVEPPSDPPLTLGLESLNHYDQASSSEEDFDGLRGLARRSNEAAAELKMMKKMSEYGVGTHQIEQQAWKLKANREAKKGNLKMKKLRKGYYEEPSQRDGKYIEKEMILRMEQVHQDWKSSEKELKFLKEEKLRGARSEKERNKIKRMMKRLNAEGDKVFKEKERKNNKKVEHQRRKVAERMKLDIKQMKATKEKRFQDWIRKICSQRREEKPPDEEAPMYGEAEEMNFDEDEKSALKLPPNLVLYAKITEEGNRYETLLCHTKSRWSRKTTGSPKEQEAMEEVYGEPEEPSDAQVIEDNREREFLDPERGTLDFRRLRPTDIRDCPRLMLPQPRPPPEEAMFQAKEVLWNQVVDKYIRGHCRENGDQMVDNITKQERRGIRKLRLRAKRGEIVISTTDKSGKLTVSSMKNYLAQGEPHVAGDKVCSWKEVMKSQEEVAYHTKFISDIFNMGRDHGETAEGRLRKGLHEKVSYVPPLVMTQKDHKAMGEDGIPATRPICEATQTITQRLSDTLTDILQSVYSCDQETTEAISTEDFLSKIEKFNSQIRNGEVEAEKLTIGSLDVSALYPSINTKHASRIVRDRVIEADLKFEGINYKSALIYLKLTMKGGEVVNSKLQGILPRRLSNRGSAPTVKSYGEDVRRERWWWPTPLEELTEDHKKTILGCVVQQMTLAVFENHYYEWNGQVRKQSKGGPIGLRATQPVSRIVMDFWAKALKEICEKTQALQVLNPVAYEALVMKILIKYVDDCFSGVNTLKWGTRWDKANRVLVWSSEEEERDRLSGRSGEELTMTVFAEVASSITSYLRFTWDSPEKNPDKTMPVLDLAVWMGMETRAMGVPEEVLGDYPRPDNLGTLKTIILTKFYRKPMSRRVKALKRSAVPMGTNSATVSAEFLRRLKNTSRELPVEVVENTLAEYAQELRWGGFSDEWIGETLGSAAIGYRRMVINEVEGKGRINRPESMGRTGRRAQKLTGKASWFRKPMKEKEDPFNNKKGKKRKTTTQEGPEPKRAHLESVFFLPYTPESNLKKQLQRVEDNLMAGRKYGRVRMVERGGDSIENLLCNRKPWNSSPCSRENCPACLEKPGSCRKKNLTYKITCKTCEEAGQVAIYIGETHRAWVDRLQEHQKALRLMDKTYATVTHIQDHHSNNPDTNFSFKVLKVHKSSLERQLCEALAIANTDCNILMNKKGEWGVNMVPTMGTVVMGGMGEWAETTDFGPNERNCPNPVEEINETASNNETLRGRKRRRKCARTLQSETTLPHSENTVPPHQLHPGLPPGERM